MLLPGGNHAGSFFHIDLPLSDRFKLFLNGYCIFRLAMKQEFHPTLPITAVERDAGAAFDGKTILCASHAVASQQNCSYQHVSPKQFPITTPFLKTRKDASGKEGAIIYD